MMVDATMTALERARPMTCRKCASVGTIVELGICCRIQKWIALGPLWDEPFCPGRPARRTRPTCTGTMRRSRR